MGAACKFYFFIQEAVSKEYAIYVSDIVVEDINIIAGSKKGDGFACDIAAVQFKAIFDGKQVSKSYIAKFAPDGPKADLLKQVFAFKIHNQSPKLGQTYNF